jgi:hypothetical protein
MRAPNPKFRICLRTSRAWSSSACGSSFISTMHEV